MRATLVIIFCSIALLIYGQDSLRKKTHEKGYIAFVGGLCAPTGDFAAKALSDQSGGPASAGWTAEFTYAQKIYKTIGVSATFRGQFFSINKVDLAKQLSQEYSYLENPELEATPWKTQAVMIGLYNSVDLIKRKLFFDSRLMVGEMLATTPSVYYIEQTSGCKRFFNQFTCQTQYSIPAFLVGTGLRLDLSKHINLLVNADYFWTKPMGVITHIDKPDLTHYLSGGTHPISSINLTGGIAFRFE